MHVIKNFGAGARLTTTSSIRFSSSKYSVELLQNNWFQVLALEKMAAFWHGLQLYNLQKRTLLIT